MQAESPVLAWLMDAIANWSCEECGNLLCEHAAQTAREDLAVDVIMQMLSVLAVTVLPPGFGLIEVLGVAVAGMTAVGTWWNGPLADPPGAQPPAGGGSV